MTMLAPVSRWASSRTCFTAVCVSFVSCATSVMLLCLVLACAGTDASPPHESWDADMTTELLRRVAEDQAARERLVVAMRAGAEPDSATLANLSTVDSANVAWMEAAMDSHGWPDRSTVGEDGASAAFLLVQHADRDTAFQARVLPALEDAWRRGEAQAQHVALLTDRLAKARGEPQLYGTQATMRDGRIVLTPIRDSSGVDARRAEMGLPPLAEYLRVLDSVYIGTERKRP